MCDIYAAALVAATEGLPWVRAVDLWHISSIPEHDKVFLPEVQPLHDTSSLSEEDEVGASVNPQSVSEATEPKSFTGVSGMEGAHFDEKIVGRTWAGSPVVVLRSLRTPGRDEALRGARWLRESGDGNIHRVDAWTDQRLRLLADEWQLCAGQGRGTRFGVPSMITSPLPAVPIIGTSSKNQGGGSAEADIATTVPVSRSTPLTPVRPFMAHSGHLIVPFTNGRVREDPDVVGHGLALAVDRGVDWTPWESHLIDVAAAATRRFEALEDDALAAEKVRVKSWAAKILSGDQNRYVARK